MLQIRTQIQGENKFLDLYQDEPVLLSLSFAELQDITKKNSTFSKGFALPGSKKNNEIFNYFYDLNAIPTNFNPNDKFDAQLLWDGYELFQGNIRLDGVTIAKGGEIIYNVTFYNQIGDLMANIGSKFLYDTNLSSISHPYQKEVVLQSIYDPTLFPLTGTTNYSYQNGKTFWGLYNIGYEYISGTTVNGQVSPFIQFSPVVSASTGPAWYPISDNFDFSGTPVNDYYFKPTIQVKTLYEAICADAGYEVSSSFFNTDYFKHFYLPLKYLDETIYARNSVFPCYKFGPQDFVIVVTPPTYVNPSSAVTCNALFSANTTTLAIPSEYGGDYTFRFTFNVINYNCTLTSLPPYVSLTFTDGFQDVPLYLQYFCGEEPVQISFNQTFSITGNSQLQFYFSGENTTVSGFTTEIVSAPRFIPTGTTINYAEEFPTNDYTQLDFITSVNRYFNLVVVPDPEKPKQLIIEPIVDYIGKGPTLDWTTKIDFNQSQQVFPTTSLVNGTLNYEFRLDQDYTNQDFKTQANRIFGTDKIKLNLPYKDTETKFDTMFSSPIDITIDNAYVPLLTVPALSKVKTVEVQGTSQQTFVPFKILPRLIFRGPTLPQDNWGFVGGVQTVSASPLCSSGVTVNITSIGWIRYEDCFQNLNFIEYTTLGPKIIPGCINSTTVNAGFPYANVATFTLTSTGTTCGVVVQPAVYQSYYIDSYEAKVFTNLNRFTTYPYNYLDFSHYCNYRGEDKTNVVPEEFTFLAEDLYDIYYKPYVDDLISDENKIYKAKIYLYPNDINSLRWNEKILINNTYFRINNIANFNALEPGICDIELVKLTREYEPHRVLYYDLSGCTSGSTTYHSNSDLMYHLYTYAGNYVRLFDDDLNYLGCYFVSIGQYNSAYTYEHFYLSSGYTDIDLINVYPDCNCTGRTQLTIVQQTPPPVTPSPTPSFTPTPSTTPCINCYVYYFTASTSGLLSWLDCDGILTDTFVSSGGTYTISCTGAREGSVAGTGTIIKGALCSSTCPTPTPSVTNTSTPAITPTQTPTPTPSSTVAVTPTNTSTPTQTQTPTQTINLTPSNTSSPTPTPTNTGSETPTPTNTATQTVTPTNTATQTVTPTSTPPSVTPTNTQTPTQTPPSYVCYYFQNEDSVSSSIFYYGIFAGSTSEVLTAGNSVQRCVDPNQFAPYYTGGVTTIGPCSSATSCTDDGICEGCT